MAEIPVERKSSMAWLWILLALIILGLLLWWALDDGEEEVAVQSAPTEIVGEQTPAADPMASPAPGGTEAGMSIAAILANPTEYVGRDDFQAEVGVPEVPTDRGFWVEDQGNRLFAIIIDEPREVPLDINAGQRLRVTKGMIRDATFLSQIPGRTLDADTKRIVQDQDAYLIVNEDNIEILSRPAN